MSPRLAAIVETCCAGRLRTDVPDADATVSTVPLPDGTWETVVHLLGYRDREDCAGYSAHPRYESLHRRIRPADGADATALAALVHDAAVAAVRCAMEETYDR